MSLQYAVRVEPPEESGIAPFTLHAVQGQHLRFDVIEVLIQDELNGEDIGSFRMILGIISICRKVPNGFYQNRHRRFVICHI